MNIKKSFSFGVLILSLMSSLMSATVFRTKNPEVLMSFGIGCVTEGLHYSVTRITIIQKYLGINASFTSSYQYKKTRFAPLIINYAGSSCFIKTKRLLTSGKKFLPSCDCCLQPSLKIPDSVVMDSRHHKEGKTTVRFSINSSR